MSEKQKAAARENGKKGGRPFNTKSLTFLRQTTRELVAAEAVESAKFLAACRDNKLKDAHGKKIEVPIEVRERAAARLFAKGVPDQLQAVSGFLETETTNPKTFRLVGFAAPSSWNGDDDDQLEPASTNGHTNGSAH